VVFNFLAGRLVARFQTGDPLQLPALGAATLLRGLVVTGCGWLMHGLALWALLQAVLPEPPALAVDVLARYSGAVALAYVSGFLVLVAPGGLGVREYFLLHLLRPDGPGPLIAVAVLLLRLVVTAAELLAAAALYWLPHEPPGLSRRSGFIRRSPNGE